MPPAAPPAARLLILVGLDGFRWDAMTRGRTPNLDRLAARGVRATMKPVFPSLTFPNLYALVTGLYPEHNGIVANEAYDPDLDAYFSSRVFDDARWWGGEPIWVTVERAGLASATTGWIGSGAPIMGVRPTHFVPFSDGKSVPERVEDLLRQLDATPRPVFLTFYHDDVDNHAHDFGVGSPEEKAAIERMDDMLGRLMAGLETRGRFDEANIVIVADHGMTNLEPSHVIYLDDYIPIDAVREDALGLGPIASLWPRDGDADALYKRLTGAHPRMTVYRRNDIPERFRIRAHRRTPPLLAVADEGWLLSSHRKATERRLQTSQGRATRKVLGGMHGYDNDLRSMQAFFLASGPAFRAGVSDASLESVDVYQLMTHALGLNAAPNDGKLSRVCAILRNPPAACGTN
jgi:predicted AlkP superfamily pyrophosphatase or phosphodiesterase